MKRSFLSSLLLSSIALVVTSCFDEPFNSSEQWNKEVKTIEEYIADKNLVATKDPSGVFVVIDSMGGGLPASRFNSSAKLTVDYTGRLFSNGKQFDKGSITTDFNSVIAGWYYALTSIPVGSKATVYIPSGYAYGHGGNGPIPGDATLVFEMFFKSVAVTDAEKAKLASDTTTIYNYLQDNAIVTSKDMAKGTGIHMLKLKQGLGDTPGLYDNIKTTYRIYSLSDSTLLRSSISTSNSSDTTVTARVVDFLQGMQIGYQNLQPGGKMRVYIPSYYGFAGATIPAVTQGTLPQIPANTRLMVDIELISIEE